MKKLIQPGLYMLLGFFTVLMINITLPYFSLDDRTAFLRIKQWVIHNEIWKLSFYVHVFASCLCLLAGFSQFSKTLLTKHPIVHRGLGWIYVIIVLVFSGPSGLVMAFYANGGLTSQTAFCMLSVFWMAFTYLALSYACKKDIAVHQSYMIRSYALTLSAVTLRAWKYLIVLWFRPHPMDVYMIVAWLGWIPNLLFAEWYIRFKLKDGKLI